ncbi:MAG: hypothetical protein ACRDH9_04415 [Actinomycetota bacterium]
MATDEAALYRLRVKLYDVLGAEEAETVITLLRQWPSFKSNLWFGLKLTGIFAVYVTWLFVIVPALAK